MISPSNIARAEELLPCSYVGKCNSSRCACRSRPAVSQALQDKDDRIAELEKALEPFAKAADIKLCGEWRDDQRFGQTDVAFHLTFGDLRKARSALSPQKTGEAR